MKNTLKLSVLVSLLFIFLQTNGYSQTEKPENLCADISKINSIPIEPRDAGFVDKAYQDLIKHGEKAIPCLIESITNTKKMKDPACPGFGDVAVGDVAYFVLQEIANFKFEEMFPKDFQEELETDGKFAYLKFMSKKKNRKQLQTTLKRWYSSRNQTEK